MLTSKLLRHFLIFTLLFTMIPAAAMGAKDESKVKAEIDAYVLINAEFGKKNEPVNVQKIIDTYNSVLKNSVKSQNEEVNNVIETTLEAVKNNELEIPVAAQLVGKTLQRYFYLAFTDLTKVQIDQAFADKAKATALMADAKAYYEGVLQGTVQKRDNTYQLGLIDIIAGSLAEMEKAIQEGNKLNYKLNRQIVDKTFIRTIYLAVDTYSKKFPIANKTEANAAQAEGWAFYQIIKDSLSKTSPEAAALINTRFTPGQPSSVINNPETEKLFARAFASKVRNYIKQNLTVNLPNQELEKAQEAAVEGNSFLTSLQLPVTNKLGKETWAKIEAAAAGYFAAVSANDAGKAKAESDIILAVLDQLEGKVQDKLVLQIGQKNVIVNGKEIEFDVPAYVNGKTNRTMVPLRVLEQLGAQVKWNEQSREVTVTLLDKTVIAKIGSSTIVKNGAAIKVDAAAEIKENRSFVPLRAIVEGLGLKITWDPGTKRIAVNQ